jgi:hypothetical protein
MTIIYGADSETLAGPPITFQFFNPKNSEMIWVNEHNSFKNFIEFLDFLPMHDSKYVFYALNLEFDINSFFYSELDRFRLESVDFEIGNWRIKGHYGRPYYLFLTHKSGHKSVALIAIDAFFKGSLEKLSEKFCPEMPKLPRPEGLGEKLFLKTDQQFIDYSMRDAEICFKIGSEIQAFHEEMDIPQCVSAPQMAARIFKRHFMKQPIPNPGKGIYYSALRSFHGGKNLFTAEPGLYDCYGLDIVSAYSWAMAQMPSFYDESLYKWIKTLRFPVPPTGIYKISGRIIPCKWPILYDSTRHGMIPATDVFENIEVTGYELNEAVEMGECEITACSGWYYNGIRDKNMSPLKQYALEMFDKKNTEKNPVKREFYKLLNNSLYGKFIQKRLIKSLWNYDVQNETLSNDTVLLAGGLFQPFIASCITGKVRARIHQLEHKYQSLHTSTDGIITQLKPDELDINPNELGKLKIEFQGKALFFRNRLYLGYAQEKTSDECLESTIFPGWFIVKYASHGVRKLTPIMLEQMYSSGKYEYDAIHVNKLKESFRRGLVINKFETRKHKIHLKGKENNVRKPRNPSSPSNPRKPRNSSTTNQLELGIKGSTRRTVKTSGKSK